MSAENLVECRGLRARRGRFVLQLEHWDVPRGSVVGVLGRNGAGKTTLLRLLPGLDAADEGELRVVGRDPIDDVVGVRERVGFMSDDMPVFALPIARLLWRLSGYYPGWDAELVDELLDRFELSPHAHAAELSKGEATRLRLVLALAHRPRLVVLDEPATGLDIPSRRRLLETLLEQVQDPMRSVVISSHQVGDVERVADRLLVLDKGRILREGAADELVGERRSLEEAFLRWIDAP